MARFLTDRLTSTCAVALLLSGCGGRTSDIDYELPEIGGTTNGGWTSMGGAKPYGGTTQPNGGSPPIGTGGYTGTGGYAWATGGYYWATGGRTATGGYRATGGYPYATGGYPYASGGKATGGKAGSGNVSGYSFAGGGTAGRINMSGSAGIAPRGGSGGTAGTAGTAGIVFVSGGTAGRTATGGNPPTSGAAGCPAIGCMSSCPIGYWASVNGCSSCACAPPPKQMSYETMVCATDSLTVSVTPQQQTGTWVFNFTWTCTSTVAPAGIVMGATVGVTIFNNSADPITASNRTITYNVATSSVPIVFSNPQFNATSPGMPQTTVALTPSNGAYLSIRREGDNFVGGLYLPATPVGGTASVMLAGSFTVAVP